MILSFDPANNFHFHWCGKFTSPNSDWIHLTRSLEDYELMIVTDGILSIADHETEYTIRKGEYLLMSPTSYQHGTKSCNCDFYWLHFGYHKELQDHLTTPSYRDSLPGILQIPVTGTLSSPERLIILMKQLQDSDKRYKDASLNRYLCSSVLSELHAQSKYRLHKDKQLKEQLYFDITDYISWHIQENLRISEIAAHFGYNEKYLSTHFKKKKGVPYTQYLREQRIKHAVFLIEQGVESVKNVALLSGFRDAFYFSKVFTASVGMPPKDYIKSIQIEE